MTTKYSFIDAAKEEFLQRLLQRSVAQIPPANSMLPVDPVEEHLATVLSIQNRAQANHNPLAPAFFQIFSPFVRVKNFFVILSILGFLSIFFPETLAFLSASVPREDEATYEEASKVEGNLESQFSPVVAPGEAPSEEKEKELVSFIAGVIAVHHPKIQDAGKVSREIVQVSQKNGLDPLYVAAVISVESHFFNDARSNKGAMGLMQLLPQTAQQISRIVTGRRAYPQLSDPHTNIELGIAYIKLLEDQFNQDRFLALAAYNWGPANVELLRDGKKRLPIGVQEYAHKILERTVNWQNHFRKALES